jgi:hypothetical protein
LKIRTLSNCLTARRQFGRRDNGALHDLTGENVDLDAIRKRIAGLSDEELLQYGRDLAFVARNSDRETWRGQLEEARAEWRRRHPRAATPE